MTVSPQFYNMLENMTQEERDTYVNEMRIMIKQVDIVTQESMKKAQNGIYKCLHEVCTNNSQKYCHLMQKNGVLSYIASNKHLYQLQRKSPHEWLGEKSDMLDVQQVGVNKAFSGKILCDEHDTILFQKLEIHTPDFYDYESQLLLCYRSILYEIWQNLLNIEYANICISKAKILLKDTKSRLQVSLLIEQEICGYIYSIIESSRSNRVINNNNFNNLSRYKDILTIALSNTNSNMMTFICVEIKQLPIATSLILSSEKYIIDGQYNNPYFIQTIPQESKTYIIVGYFNSFSDEWIMRYLEKWSCFTEYEIQVELTRLITTKSDAWCMSPCFYENLSDTVKQKIKDDFIYYYENMFSDKYWYENNMWNIFI